MGAGETDFDPERQARAKRQQRGALARGLLALALFLSAAWVSLPTGLSARLGSWAASLTGHPWLIVALYTAAAYLALAALALPLRVAGRLSDLRYDLSKQSWPSWALDRMKALGLGLPIALVAVEALYWSLRNFGDVWWIVFGAFVVGFTLVVGYVGPVVLLPIFYPVARVEDEELADRLRATARRAGIRTLGVYEFRSSAKTERGTAALAGLGRTKRILLSDHILEHFTPDEVEGILAHELAHQVQNDTLLYLVLTGLVSLLGLYLADVFVRFAAPFYGFEELGNVATLPLFALFAVAYSAASRPGLNAVSRWREARADKLGAIFCGKPEALASALIKLHDRNLADATPPSWVEAFFYSHPSGKRRVEALRARNGS